MLNSNSRAEVKEDQQIDKHHQIWGKERENKLILRNKERLEFGKYKISNHGENHNCVRLVPQCCIIDENRWEGPLAGQSRERSPPSTMTARQMLGRPRRGGWILGGGSHGRSLHGEEVRQVVALLPVAGPMQGDHEVVVAGEEASSAWSACTAAPRTSPTSTQLDGKKREGEKEQERAKACGPYP